MSKNYLEQQIKNVYLEKSDNTNTEVLRTISTYNAVEKYAFKIDSLKTRLSDTIDSIVTEDGIIKSAIRSTYRGITEIVARASIDNKYSKLYIPSTVDTTQNDSVQIKDGVIYGNSEFTSGTNSIDLTTDNTNVSFHTTEGSILAKITKKNSNDEYLKDNFTAAPSIPINKTSELIISIRLDKIESVSNMIIDMDRSRNIKVFYREPGREDFVFLSEDNGSKIAPVINKSITDMKIVIQVKHSGREYGGVYFNQLKINRYSLSEDLHTDIKVEVASNAKMVEVVRCDTENDNIEYLVSVNGRAFKNATESPVSAYGIEDGEIYSLSSIREYTVNAEGFMLFSIPTDNVTASSNEWIGFTGKDEYNETDIGSMEFYECHAIYRDIFTIKIPNNKYIYMDGKKCIGPIIIYPGVYKIEIPKSEFTKYHSLKFYDKIEYDGKIISLTRQDGGIDTVNSIDDIFAQIETTASNIFSENHGLINHVDRIIELKTTKTMMYLGFRSISPKIDFITLRIKFKKSSKAAKVNFTAIKTY